MRRTVWGFVLAVMASLGCAETPATGDAVKVDLSHIARQGKLETPPGVAAAGQPDAAALAALANSGYVAVIDLRTDREDRGLDERKIVEALGMRYVSLPVAWAEGVTFDNAATLDRLVEEAGGPVLVHCASGNRVGALLALRRSLAGADDESAIAEGKAAGLTGLEAVVRKRLAAD